MADKENKSYNNIIKIDDKSGECACSLPKPGDFKQVITLKNSGLTIFLHRNVEVQKTSKKKSEETFILHNIGDKKLNRPDYINEMCQYKTNCIKCKSLVQKVHGLIDEIKDIKTDEVIGVCEYCKRSNVASKCRRCEYIVGKYLALKNNVYKNKQARFVSWLTKVDDLLRNILDVESICKHRLYRDSHSVHELKQLLSELRSPLSQRQPEITYFPTTAPEPFMSFSTLEQSKEMLEGILKRIKTEKSKHYTSEDSLLLSSSRSSTGCVCKYFMSKRMEGRRSMEVLPQEKYYPPGLITSREFARSLSSELRFRGSLEVERYGRRRSSSAEYLRRKYSDYSRDGTSKERGRRFVLDKISSEYISGRSQYSGRARDEYTRGRGSKRDEYGRERGSKRDEYESDRESKRDEYGKERRSKRGEYERERRSNRDEYERERRSKRDEYESGRGSKRDEYGKERGSKRDEYGSDKERRSKRDEYERGRGSKRDEYERGRGSKRDEYGKERGSKRDEYGSDKERRSKRDEYERGRGSKRDEYERGRGSKRDEYGKERGSKRKEYGSERGTKRDEYGKDSGLKRDEHGSARGSKRDEHGREKASKKEITTGAKDKLPGIVSQKSRADEDISGKRSGKSMEGKSKRESLKEHTKEGKSKEDRLKEDSTKRDKEGKIKEVTKKDVKLGDSIELISKDGKSKKDKSKEHDTEEDMAKKETAKEEDLKDEKKGKGKTDKEERSSKKLKEDIVITDKSSKKKKKEAIVIIKDEETRKRLKKKGQSTTKEQDKDKESEESVSDVVDVKTLKKTKGKKDKEKSTTVIPIKKKKASSEAVLLLKMMKEMRMKRQKEKENKKEALKDFASLAALPVIRRRLKSKVEPTVSESFIECDDYQAREVKKIIIGNEIHHFDPTCKMGEKRDHQPLLFEIMQSFPDVVPPHIEAPPPGASPEIKKRPSSAGPKVKSKSKMLEIPAEGTAGVMKYQLSNRKYIEQGWTILPTTKVLRKMNTYNMKLASPEFDFFKMNKKKKVMFYDSGEKLAEIYSNEDGKWFYKNGNLALHCYKPKEPNVRKRYIIYSSGAEIENGTLLPITILGLFDQLGNAVIYDYFGNVRLKYNQTEGVIVDEKIGPPGRWKWHTLNDPPVLQPVFIDTYVQERDQDLEEVIRNEREAKSEPSRIIKDTNVDMIMIEFENFVREKAHKLLQKFKPFQIRMKAVKINKYFSIRVLDQASVTLTFQDTPNTLKLHLGMNLINSEIVDTETSEVSEVATPYDRIPARTQSVSDIQEALLKTRKYGKNLKNKMQSAYAVNLEV